MMVMVMVMVMVTVIMMVMVMVMLMLMVLVMVTMVNGVSGLPDCHGHVASRSASLPAETRRALYLPSNGG